VKDHHASETLACVDLSCIEVGRIDVLEIMCWVVSNVLSRAVVSAITIVFISTNSLYHRELDEPTLRRVDSIQTFPR
jgi:hypothetical protein